MRIAKIWRTSVRVPGSLNTCYLSENLSSSFMKLKKLNKLHFELLVGFSLAELLVIMLCQF